MNNKIIRNNLDVENIVYFECQSTLKFLYLKRLNTNKLMIGYLGDTCSIDNSNDICKEYIFKDLEEICKFHYYCYQLLDGRKTSFVSISDDLILKLESKNNIVYNISAYSSILPDTKIWEIILNKSSFEDFTYYMRKMLDKITLDLIPFKIGMQVEIKHKEDMTPKFIDEIGRYHFDLGDDSDIIFNSDMAEYSGMLCKVCEINPFIDIHGNVNCTLSLSCCSESDKEDRLWFYMFSPHMVNIIY